MSATPDHFRGKVALVTGAGTGIGRAAALTFAQAGADLVLAGRRRPELEAVAREIEANGSRALVVPTDVASPGEVGSLVDVAIERFGRLDAAFNNAGIEGAFAPITELTPEQFDETIGVNLRGA